MNFSKMEDLTISEQGNMFFNIRIEPRQKCIQCGSKMVAEHRPCVCWRHQNVIYKCGWVYITPNELRLINLLRERGWTRDVTLEMTDRVRATDLLAEFHDMDINPHQIPELDYGEEEKAGSGEEEDFDGVRL